MRNRRNVTALLALAAALLTGLAPAKAQKWAFVNATSVAEANGVFTSGRVNVAVSDPRNANVMYIGTDGGRPTGLAGDPEGTFVVGLPDTGGGGVWKTTNWLSDNPNWVALTDDMPSLSIGVHGLAIAPSNLDVLYAAADGPQGAVLQTRDAGKHWGPLGEELFFGVKFGGIAVTAANPDEVYVAVFQAGTNPHTGQMTPGGIYKSVDGGDSWKLVLAGATSHVVIDPSTDNVLYAGVVDQLDTSLQGVWKSVDGGRHWSSQAANFPSGTFNSTLYVELAIAPSQPNTVYAVVMTPVNTPLPQFYSTADGGKMWGSICTTVSPPDLPDNRFWHQILTVHPQYPQTVFAEGLNHIGVFSTTGGQSSDCNNALPWTQFWTGDDPAGVTFYDDPTAPGGLAFAAFGDRGIYRVVNTTSPSDTDFTHKQGNLANPLLETLAADPQQPSTLYGVAFDQSPLYTSAITEPFWTHLSGSEVGKNVVNPNNSGIVYNLCAVDGEDFCKVDNFITRLSNGQESSIANGFSDADFTFDRAVTDNPAGWKAFEFDPTTTEGLLYGGTRVWAWTEASGQFTALTTQPLVTCTDNTCFISALGIAPSNPKRVYVGTSEGTMFVTSDRSSWPQITTLTLPAGSFVSRIQVNPANPDQLVIAVQDTTGARRVWVGNHGGNDWTDLTRDLPEGLQAYTVAVDWRFPNPDLYVGTDRGVYASKLKGEGWRLFGVGLPKTLISDLEITPGGVLTAAAYGRGAFQLGLPRRQ